MKKQIFILLAMLVLSGTQRALAQSLVDAALGTSTEDRVSINLAYRYQVSEKYRIGLEAQYGLPKYRFVDAKLIPKRKGYTSTFSVPLTLRLYEKDQMRLDLFARAGVRFQGMLDPDGNDKRDSILASTAFNFEPGLLVTIKASEKINFQSGFSFPFTFQTSPSSLFESVHPPIVYAGMNGKISENRTFFVKTLFGPAIGGNGDTYKFSWSVQCGIRHAFGKKTAASFVESSF